MNIQLTFDSDSVSVRFPAVATAPTPISLIEPSVNTVHAGQNLKGILKTIFKRLTQQKNRKLVHNVKNIEKDSIRQYT